MSMFSSQQFDSFNELLEAKDELEGIFKAKRHYYVTKFEINSTEEIFILNSKIFIICPN